MDGRRKSFLSKMNFNKEKIKSLIIKSINNIEHKVNQDLRNAWMLND